MNKKQNNRFINGTLALKTEIRADKTMLLSDAVKVDVFGEGRTRGYLR